MKRKLDRQGFTYIELIVVLIIISLMVILGGGSYLSWMPNIEYRKASNQLIADFQLARVEAVKNNTEVRIVFEAPSLYKDDCSLVPDEFNDKTQVVGKYTIFIDENDNKTPENGEVLKETELTGGNYIAICEYDFKTADKDITGFMPDGVVSKISGSVKDGSVKIKSINGRQGVLTLTGAGNFTITRL